MGSYPVIDTLVGTNGDDVFNLLAAPYSQKGITKTGQGYAVFARDGDDTVYGTHHDDYVSGEVGDDTLYGHRGADSLWGDVGEDTIYGGADDDRISGNEDNDTLEGNGGDDIIRGDQGDDLIYGDDFASEGGAPGNDELYGGDGNDTIFGQDGDDRILSGRGNDIVSGGAGADVFEYRTSDLTTYSWPTGSIQVHAVDTITDFSAAEGDRIDLRSLIDGKTNFLGTTAAEAIAQGYIYWEQHGASTDPDVYTTVYLDRNGGTHSLLARAVGSEMAIAQLEGVTASQLNASLFLV
jgi:Ca2+-binding RTX toxin-like protein